MAGFAVVKAMVSDHGEEVPKEILERRMAVCEACPIYRLDLGTCGPVEHAGREMGCFCYMRALAQLKSGHCWLHDNAPLSGLGWPDDLL